MRSLRRRYIHQILAYRPSRIPKAGGVLSNAQLLGGCDCLVLGLNGAAQSSPLGRVDGAKWTITWSDLELQDGDLVEYDGRRYTLREVLRDNVGGYSTGVLSDSSGSG